MLQRQSAALAALLAVAPAAAQNQPPPAAPQAQPQAQPAPSAGSPVAIPGFCEELGTATGLPVMAGVVEEAREGGHGGIAANRLAIAAGLAIEEAPARTAVAPPTAPEPTPDPAEEAA